MGKRMQGRRGERLFLCVLAGQGSAGCSNHKSIPSICIHGLKELDKLASLRFGQVQGVDQVGLLLWRVVGEGGKGEEEQRRLVVCLV